MPPWREWLSGRDAIRLLMGQAMVRWGGCRARVLRDNGRCAVVLYARTSEDETWRPHSLDVLEIFEGAIASVVAFVGPQAASLFSSAGLPVQPPGDPIHHWRPRPDPGDGLIERDARAHAAGGAGVAALAGIMRLLFRRVSHREFPCQASSTK